MNDTHIKENLARITDLVKFAQRIIELIVIISSQGRNPSLDFLWQEEQNVRHLATKFN